MKVENSIMEQLKRSGEIQSNHKNDRKLVNITVIQTRAIDFHSPYPERHWIRWSLASLAYFLIVLLASS